jgi:hypothetical protein
VVPLSGQPSTAYVNGAPVSVGRSGINLPGLNREIVRAAFLTANGTLCMTLGYLTSLYQDKGKWIYGCEAKYRIPPTEREPNQNTYYNEPQHLAFPYVQIVVDKTGKTGVVPVLEIYKLLYLDQQYKIQNMSSLRRVYHLRLLEGEQLDYTTQRSTFDTQYNYGDHMGERSVNSPNTPHCQAGTTMLIYFIAVCNGDHCSITNSTTLRREEEKEPELNQDLVNRLNQAFEEEADESGGNSEEDSEDEPDENEYGSWDEGSDAEQEEEDAEQEEEQEPNQGSEEESEQNLNLLDAFHPPDSDDGSYDSEEDSFEEN